MKTGDTVRDARGRTYQVGQLLGRGLWGRTYSAREDAGGAHVVIKVPHSRAELPDQDEALAEACREIALEQSRLLEQGGHPALPRLETRIILPDGTPALVMPKASATLEQRLSGGGTLDEVLGTLSAAVKQLQALAPLQPFHGNLKPTNILVAEGGAVLLADPVTPVFRRVFPQLLKAARNATGWCAPEVRDAVGSVPFGAPTDTYSIAMMLYRGAAATPGHERFPDLPAEGLDKARLVALKDRVLNRLKKEHSNPRFHNRLADRLAALLNRALSRQTSPSPPYRFRRLDEMLARLGEVQAMVHPTVTHVGRLILDQKPGNEAFLTDEAVGFSCTVACSPGVENHEEIATGLAIFDADRDERLRVQECSYNVDRHPSGRFRFGFKIGELPPGGYRVRVAFTIRDSGDEPATAEGELRVRPAPGYVPPRREDPIPAPIPLERASDPDSDAGSVTEPGVAAASRRRVTSLDGLVRGDGLRPTGPAVASAVEPVEDPTSARRRMMTSRHEQPVAASIEDDGAELPPPTPIAPAGFGDRRPTRGRPAPARPAAALALKAVPQELDDDDDISVEEEPPPLRPDRFAARDAQQRPTTARPLHAAIRPTEIPRNRPEPLPDGPLPGAPQRAPLNTRPGLAGGPGADRPALASASTPTRTMGTATTAARSTGPAMAAGGLAAAIPAEPAFAGAGRWSELPLPIHEADDLLPDLDEPAAPVETTLDPETSFDEGSGPVGALIARVIETVRGDAYVMFLGSIAAAIVILTVILLLIRG